MFGQHGTPFLLCENLSRLALLAHLFNGKSFAFCLKIDSYYFCVLCSGCEIGFKAQERLAKELLVKSLSSRPVSSSGRGAWRWDEGGGKGAGETTFG